MRFSAINPFNGILTGRSILSRRDCYSKVLRSYTRSSLDLIGNLSPRRHNVGIPPIHRTLILLFGVTQGHCDPPKLGTAKLASFRQDLSIWWRGALMGIADVIPGVSGGTVALLVGIYPRLVSAIASVDKEAFGLLVGRRWGDLAKKIDLRFLLALGGGIGSGLIVTLLTVVKLLSFDFSRQLVLASFLGMLLAAAVILWRRIEEEFPTTTSAGWACAIIGLALALSISLGQQLSPQHSPTHGYIFVCGALGICAMILPGISGAMVLLLLGVYPFLLHLADELKSGQHVVPNLIYLFVFALGCLTGVLTVARGLKWLLVWSPHNVMLLLWGLMIGALPTLWPYQTNLAPDQPKLNLRQYQMRMPDFSNLSDYWPIGLVIVSLILILGLERLAQRGSSQEKMLSGFKR